LAYPVEDDSPQMDWHDGVFQADAFLGGELEVAERTLVVACCDPAAGLLATEYARQFQLRMIVLRRSSRQALDLVATGKAHVAGIHLSGVRQSENVPVARSVLGERCSVVRVARWEEGLAVHPRLGKPTIGSLTKSKLRWVGREEGSGARQCQDAILGDRWSPKRIAFDHRSVVAAVRCGWADIGPCVRLPSEEGGLRFVKVQGKDYDLCFAGAVESDARLAALLATLRSRTYRVKLSELPGYSTKQTGELLQ
jgi:molybdate-binding protein